jgi:hypothetical protein
MGAFLQGLQQLGWIDGRSVRIDTRWPAGDAADTRKYGGISRAFADTTADPESSKSGNDDLQHLREMTLCSA